MSDYTGKTVFLGIDVHKTSYSVTAICDRLVVKQDTFVANPEALLAYCKRAFKGGIIKSAYEAGFCGFALHRLLVSNNIENIVVHPASIEIESLNRKKTDKRDSKKIATQLSAGRLHCVYIPSLHQECKRHISRLREAFVKQKIRTACQLKSLLHLHGLIPARSSQRVSKKWIQELMSLDLDENLKFCINKFAQTWHYFSQEILLIDKELRLQIPNYLELYKAYRKISGIGPKISQILINELGDTLHFSNEEKLFSYCGLTPSEYSSGEHRRQGHISRQGNPVLRRVLVQAAWVAVRKDRQLAEYFEKLSLRVGSKRAIVAVARKLIGRVRCAIKKKESFIQQTKAEDRVVLQEENFAVAS